MRHEREWEKSMESGEFSISIFLIQVYNSIMQFVRNMIIKLCSNTSTKYKINIDIPLDLPSDY